MTTENKSGADTPQKVVSTMIYNNVLVYKAFGRAVV